MLFCVFFFQVGVFSFLPHVSRGHEPPKKHFLLTTYSKKSVIKKGLRIPLFQGEGTKTVRFYLRIH